jgi:hypothetical protein
MTIKVRSTDKLTVEHYGFLYLILLLVDN